MIFEFGPLRSLRFAILALEATGMALTRPRDHFWNPKERFSALFLPLGAICGSLETVFGVLGAPWNALGVAKTMLWLEAQHDFGIGTIPVPPFSVFMTLEARWMASTEPRGHLSNPKEPFSAPLLPPGAL